MSDKCNVCPFRCNANREKQSLGVCKIGGKIKISYVSTHMWEEPCISGSKGSGTVFFTGCNLRCVFCQNYKISRKESEGTEITEEELADIFIKKEQEGVHNINLVSPTPYLKYIKKAIKIAKSKGLKIPIIYNSNGYENVESIKELDGLIDVYLPDFKYGDDNLATKYSAAINYVENAIKVIKEMYRQVGNAKFDKNGIIQKGLIIRHLVLPNNIENTRSVLKQIANNIDKNVYVSLMGQYIPQDSAMRYPELNRKVTREEYDKAIDYFFEVGLENGFMQELDSASEEYIPEF
jgi:putative pyruvate formate lyase activating enzyme